MGWSSPNEEAIADRYHDERKHDFPLHAEPKRATTALEIAVLCQAISIHQAADLIEQFGNTRAAEGRLEGVGHLDRRLAVALEAPLTPAAKPVGHYGEMCMNPSLCAGKGYCPRDPNCAD